MISMQTHRQKYRSKKCRKPKSFLEEHWSNKTSRKISHAVAQTAESCLKRKPGSKNNKQQQRRQKREHAAVIHRRIN